MTTIINIHEAKTHLSRIVEEVAAGKEVIIAKAGKPMIPADFNKPLPEAVIQLFERD
jgi:PIN domain nuclease of toxin-antitoxin system/antitoxin (DNA-binding transcriptional repressor) of toxin-antitoxin stability system